MTKVRDYNNAGVRCVEAGLYKEGWDLFKGALELELGSQQQSVAHTPAEGAATRETSHPKACGAEKAASSRFLQQQKQRSSLSESFVARAEERFQTLDSLLGQQLQSSPPSAPRESPLGCSIQGLPVFEPFIYSKPFLIPSPETERRSEASSTSGASAGSAQVNGGMSDRTVSSSLIFNLALVEQLNQRTSRQAIHLYQLAASLLMVMGTPERRPTPPTPPPVSILGMSLLNNMGVWCYENGDIGTAQRCMEYLERLLTAVAQYRQSTLSAPLGKESGGSAAPPAPLVASCAATNNNYCQREPKRRKHEKEPCSSSNLLQMRQEQQKALQLLSATVGNSDLESFRINVRWILHPPGGTSPAA